MVVATLPTVEDANDDGDGNGNGDAASLNGGREDKNRNFGCPCIHRPRPFVRETPSNVVAKPFFQSSISRHLPFLGCSQEMAGARDATVDRNGYLRVDFEPSRIARRLLRMIFLESVREELN